jgi:hypothetical protein
MRIAMLSVDLHIFDTYVDTVSRLYAPQDIPRLLHWLAELHLDRKIANTPFVLVAYISKAYLRFLTAALMNVFHAAVVTQKEYNR